MEYPLILSLALLFMLFLISTNHLIGAFLALVGFSLNLYVLILFDASNSAAREAGIKYYYLSTFSSGLILYGIFLSYVITGALEFSSIELFLSALPTISSYSYTLLPVALAFLFTGLFFKLSAFPGHLWAAEVYDGSPEPVTAFFMLPVKVTVLAFVIQLLDRALSPVLSHYQPMLMVAATGSLIWGCFGALIEKKTKRFLAYASINHMGFILLGLAVGTFASLRATLLYILIYNITSVLFLFFFLNGRRGMRPLLYLTDLIVINQNWRHTWAVAASIFSMAGIPPLAGFFSKYYLLLHAQEAEWYGLVIVALATSLISAYYYLRVLKIMWFGSITTHTTPIQPSESDQLLLLIAEALLWLFGLIVGYALFFCGYW
jgi:NADH-quinone oxidoreductase subunit N